jgi:hypothetical protein
MPDRRGRLREQKLVRLVKPFNPGQRDNRGHNRGNSMPEHPDQPGTDRRGSPWLEGSVHDDGKLTTMENPNQPFEATDADVPFKG